MRRTVIQAMALIAAASACSVGHAAVVNAAYNDCAPPNTAVTNVTTYTTTPTAQNLVDVTTGNPFGAVLMNVFYNPGNSGASSVPDSTYQIYQVFNGYVNTAGYNNPQVTSNSINYLVFSGLNPNDTYDLVVGATRNANTYGLTIQNATSFTNATSTTDGTNSTIYGSYSGGVAGTFTPVTDPAQYASANTALAFDDGKIVLHFTNIVPTIDGGTGLGTFSVNLLGGGTTLGKVGGLGDANGRMGAFRLEETSVPEPVGLSLLGLGGLALLRRRR
jgi:MYXO-CTERM domain-containing protein